MNHKLIRLFALALALMLSLAATASAETQQEAGYGIDESDTRLNHIGNVEAVAPEGPYGGTVDGTAGSVAPVPAGEPIELTDDERYQVNKFLSDLAVGHFCVTWGWDDASQREVRVLRNFSSGNYDAGTLADFGWRLVRINNPTKMTSERIGGTYYDGYKLEFINMVLDLYLGIELTEAEIPNGESELFGYHRVVQDGYVYLLSGDGDSYSELSIARDVSVIGNDELQVSFDVYQVYDMDIAPLGETIQDYSVYRSTAEDAANRESFTYDYSGSAVIEFNGDLNDRSNFTLTKYTLDGAIDADESAVAPSDEAFDTDEYGVAPSDETADTGESEAAPSAGTDVAAAGRPFSEIPSVYYFSSGVGAWGTEITVNPDGSFSGHHSDTDAGDSGPGYDYTQYLSEFSGQFVNPVQIDEYTWRFELGSLTYDTPVGETEIVPDSYDPDRRVRMLYTDAYGIEGGKTFYLFMPGTPTSSLPVGFIDWANAYSAAEGSELTRCGIYNAEGQYGFIAGE